MQWWGWLLVAWFVATVPVGVWLGRRFVANGARQESPRRRVRPPDDEQDIDVA